MGSARSWMLAKARRGNAPLLDAALLTDRGLRYASSRLSLAVVRAVLRACLHGVELWLLSGLMPYEFLVPLFAMRATPALLGGLHWGALEALRDRVRRDALGSRTGRALGGVEAWLTLSAGAGALLVAGVCALVLRQAEGELGPWGLYGAFALVVSWSTALELWGRTFHAGIFALGRIYRPGWSIVLPETTELACLLLLWPFVGPFSLHVGVLITSLLRAALSYAYSGRAYRARAFNVPRPFRLRALKHLSWTDLREGTLGALASIPLQLDRLLLLVLLASQPANLADLPLSAPYYVMRPIAGLASSWARVFYVDLVRLNHAGTGMLRARFERLLSRVALVMALASSLWVALGSYLLFGMEGVWASAWFVPLAVVRGAFALQQVRAFVFGLHVRLIATGALVFVGLLASRSLGASDRVTVMVLSLLLAMALFGFRGVASRRPIQHLDHARRLSLSVWLAAVSREQRAVRISVARIVPSICTTGAAAASLSRAIEEGQLARCASKWLVWWEPAGSALSQAALAQASGCSLAEHRFVEASTGRAALMLALRSGTLPHELSQALSIPRSDEVLDALERTRSALMPGAMRIDLSQSGVALSQLPARDLTRIRRALLASAREQHHVPRWARWQAATFAPAGEATIAFVWSADQGAGSEFRRRVLHESWRASVPVEPSSRNPQGERSKLAFGDFEIE